MKKPNKLCRVEEEISDNNVKLKILDQYTWKVFFIENKNSIFSENHIFITKNLEKSAYYKFYNQSWNIKFEEQRSRSNTTYNAECTVVCNARLLEIT